ncbi:hypothetical protein DSO57_1009100 [Entomophthora muscae]|uniref:Uncharacterized protein n=1 Tax=Entomophthora muscae TaxID=34485 RepID=A0ACC2RY06_9FUNG|nr:hypothetical protein DSO57_1009100 [Entomophthora muscae]
MFFFLSFFLLLVLPAIASKGPIVFRGYPLAESSQGLVPTKLYVHPRGMQQNGAKFFYSKNGENSLDFSLAVVYLCNNKGRQAMLQTSFDTISQKCSCYWLDAHDLVSRFPTLTTGSDYFIEMEGTGYTVRSGRFTLVTGKPKRLI